MKHFNILFTLFLCSISFYGRANTLDETFIVDGIRYQIMSDTTVWLDFQHGNQWHELKGDVIFPSKVIHDGVEYSVEMYLTEYDIKWKDSNDVVDCNDFNEYEITSITLPDNLEMQCNPFFIRSDGEDYLSNKYLKALYVSPDNPNYTSVNGVLYTKDMKKIVAVPDAFETFEIPESVRIIGNRAFVGNQKLLSVSIPESVDSIEWGAFYNTKNIRDIKMPSSLSYIGAYAFYGTKSLRDIKLPSSLSYIGERAFSKSGLDSLSIPDDFKEVSAGMFDGCKNLSKLTIGRKVKIIHDSAFADCENLKYVEIPDSVEEICRRAFSGCKGLEKLVIGNGVKIIGEGAFEVCPNLRIITFGNSIEQIGESAFYHADNLQSIILPNSINTIEREAFYMCGNCKELNLGTSVKNIGKKSFGSCSSLQTVSIPKSVRKMANDSFIWCSGLKSIRVPIGLSLPQGIEFGKGNNVRVIKY